ncbi:MAG: SIS domain-containing protein [Clostridiales bacterium]|nr:SIS domain-containing protein [Clostridiales bacterium]
MKRNTQKILAELMEKYPQLKGCFSDIEKAFVMLKNCYENCGSVFVCGNGGSASDSEHIVGELLKNFKKHRPIQRVVYEKLQDFGEDGAYLCEKLEGALPAYSLNSQTGIMTAFANDKSWDAVFAQQLYGLGREGDCLISLSTSGNSKNCIYATMVAKAKHLVTISLTGEGGGELKKYCDCIIAVPEMETYKVQELHLPVYHCLCAMLEVELFEV